MDMSEKRRPNSVENKWAWLLETLSYVCLCGFGCCGIERVGREYVPPSFPSLLFTSWWDDEVVLIGSKLPFWTPSQNVNYFVVQGTFLGLAASVIDIYVLIKSKS